MKHTANEIHKYVMRNSTPARFSHYENFNLYYEIVVEDVKYIFPIDVNDKGDVGNTTFEAVEKASLLMRVFKKAYEADLVRSIPLINRGDSL